MINFIGVTDKACCELCGEKAELRPFGPRGENICFQCGMKDEATTGAMFTKRLEQGAIDIEDLGAIIHRSNLQ